MPIKLLTTYTPKKAIMKKQVLLLIALISCAHVSASTTVNVQASQEVVKAALNSTVAGLAVSTFVFGLVTLVAYKIFTDPEYVCDPSLKPQEERESYFFQYGTSFPTQEQLNSQPLS